MPGSTARTPCREGPYTQHERVISVQCDREVCLPVRSSRPGGGGGGGGSEATEGHWAGARGDAALTTLVGGLRPRCLSPSRDSGASFTYCFRRDTPSDFRHDAPAFGSRVGLQLGQCPRHGPPGSVAHIRALVPG